MEIAIQEQLLAGLLLWALVSLGSAVVGLYLQPSEFWRSFWLMSGIWGLIDGLIGWFAMIGEPSPTARLLPILQVNAGLDLVYVTVAIIMLTRKTPMLRGFGLGVLLQGGFLLIFDSYFWWRCASLAN